MTVNYYDHILQGSDATEENAMNHARGLDWMSIEKTPQNLPKLDFIDSVNGIDVWYDRGADYYAFSDSDETNEGMNTKNKKLSLLSLYERAGDDMFKKEFEYTKEERNAFMEAVRNYEMYGEVIRRGDTLKDVVQEISELVELANGFTLKETDGWFDNVTASRHTKQMKEAVKVLQKEAKEIVQRQQRLEAAYEDIGQLFGKYYDL